MREREDEPYRRRNAVGEHMSLFKIKINRITNK